MNIFPAQSREDLEPSAEALTEIENERPLIEAELDLLDAEMAVLLASRPSDLDWRRLRRAQTRVIRAWVEHHQLGHLVLTPTGDDMDERGRAA